MKFYVTTPIYYVNDIPHIGHAYTTISADILARYNRMMGNDVFFLTGTDEHGQKVEQAARLNNRTPIEHADLMVKNFQSLWKKLNISEHAFIRTTDEGHKKVVQELLQRLFDKGEIVKKTYTGWYCTPDERFWTDKDIIDNKCPDCGRDVEKIEEENYFFLMSKYQDSLNKHIAENPSYILPETRRNEVLGFLRTQTLGDLCISRPKSRLSCGIPLPFDDNFVTYVWFDALVNYYSATMYLVPDKFKGIDFWPADHHIIGKDILTTHAIYWSAMLMALDMPLPKNIFAHGWWTIEGRKMSKSLGNVVNPVELLDKYGVDAVRYFLFREVPFGHDGDYSEEALIRRINTDLANDLGNLLSRTLTMIEKYRSGEIPAWINSKDRDGLEKRVQVEMGNYKIEMTNLYFSSALSNYWEAINVANKFIEDSAPWKEKDEGILSNILYHLAETIRLIAIYIYPFMPETAQEIWRQIGINAEIEKTISQHPEYRNWNGYSIAGIRIRKGKQLFPRIEFTKKAESPKINKTGKEATPKMEETKKIEEPAKTEETITPEPEVKDNLIALSDFQKVELKTGKVLEAERVVKSNKLIKLKVDTGEIRQVVAGIGKFFTPEELVGKTVVVVTNLQPAKLMGVESQGMLLAATDDEGILSILTTEKPVKQGARIK